MPGEFVNCDWGTTHFRLRAVRGSLARVAAEFRSDQGVAHLAALADGRSANERFRGALEHGLAQLRQQLGPTEPVGPVIISGMASSSIGWQELPYAPLPLALDGSDLLWRELEPLEGPSGPQRVILVSGARSDDDVMRGEETQVLGVFQLPTAAQLTGAALLILPGTHCKHVRVESGHIRAFRTFLTGELFDVLGKHSILRHSIDAAASGGTAADAAMADEASISFRQGVQLAADVGLSAALFRVRTRQLLDNVSAAVNRTFLSGVLVGAELAYLQGDEFADRPILLCAAAPLDAVYTAAFDALGLGQLLTIVPSADVERLSALGQGVLLRRLVDR